MPDFKPKNPVQLAPPKDDPISLEELAKADGKHEQLCYNLNTINYHILNPRSSTVPVLSHIYNGYVSAARTDVSLILPYTLLLTSWHRQGWSEVLRRNQGMSYRPCDCFRSSDSHMSQGKVYDVTGNKMYQPGNSYNGKLTRVSSSGPSGLS